MARSYWSCPGCGTRNERVKQKCSGEGCNRRRPKRRVAKHARTLRDDSYEVYVAVNAEIHGPAMAGEWSREDCGVCGKPRGQERRHDRDHDHRSGLPRGLACGGNTGCNVLMLPWITAPVAEAIAEAKTTARESDAPRWILIAQYLGRCESFRALSGAYTAPQEAE